MTGFRYRTRPDVANFMDPHPDLLTLEAGWGPDAGLPAENAGDLDTAVDKRLDAIRK